MPPRRECTPSRSLACTRSSARPEAWDRGSLRSLRSPTCGRFDGLRFRVYYSPLSSVPSLSLSAGVISPLSRAASLSSLPRSRHFPSCPPYLAMRLEGKCRAVVPRPATCCSGAHAGTRPASVVRWPWTCGAERRSPQAGHVRRSAAPLPVSGRASPEGAQALTDRLAWQCAVSFAGACQARERRAAGARSGKLRRLPLQRE